MACRNPPQKVVVLGLDGTPKELAVVSRFGNVLYLCSVERYRGAASNKALAQHVVGFSVEDVIFKRMKVGGAS